MKKIPIKHYQISFEISTDSDEFFRRKRSLKQIKEMILDELYITTTLSEIDPKKLKIMEIKNE